VYLRTPIRDTGDFEFAKRRPVLISDFSHRNLKNLSHSLIKALDDMSFVLQRPAAGKV